MKNLLVLLFVTGVAQAEVKTDEKLKIFVEDASKFVEKSGLEKACSEFSDGNSFKKDKQYIFVYDVNGIIHCHGTKKSLIGINNLNFKNIILK